MVFTYYKSRSASIQVFMPWCMFILFILFQCQFFMLLSPFSSWCLKLLTLQDLQYEGMRWSGWEPTTDCSKVWDCDKADWLWSLVFCSICLNLKAETWRLFLSSSTLLWSSSLLCSFGGSGSPLPVCVSSCQYWDAELNMRDTQSLFRAPSLRTLWGDLEPYFCISVVWDQTLLGVLRSAFSHGHTPACEMLLQTSAVCFLYVYMEASTGMHTT